MTELVEVTYFFFTRDSFILLLLLLHNFKWELSDTGKVKWIREESLADIGAIEMVDLPLSDSEGAIEKQLKSNNGMFYFQYVFF